MPKRQFVIILVTLVCLAAFAAPASAECAWVLWAKGLPPPRPLGQVGPILVMLWQPFTAYGTKQECEAAANKKEAIQKALIAEHKLSGEDQRLAVYVRCLPDTLDPRGPKGK